MNIFIKNSILLGKRSVLAYIVIILVSIINSFYFFPPYDVGLVKFAKGVIYLAIGPLTGWFVAAAEKNVISALPLVIGTSIFSLAPLICYVFIKSHHRAWLYMFVIFWVLSGLLFTVGIWV